MTEKTNGNSHPAHEDLPVVKTRPDKMDAQSLYQTMIQGIVKGGVGWILLSLLGFAIWKDGVPAIRDGFRELAKEQRESTERIEAASRENAAAIRAANREDAVHLQEEVRELTGEIRSTNGLLKESSDTMEATLDEVKELTEEINRGPGSPEPN